LPRSSTIGLSPRSRHRSAANIPAGPQPTITTVFASRGSTGADQTGFTSAGNGSSTATSSRSWTLTARWRASSECFSNLTPVTRDGARPSFFAAASFHAASYSEASRGRIRSIVSIIGEP
jgi:hypothetical protein